jgi:coenzyme F420-reducing hydrogenase delta subunit
MPSLPIYGLRAAMMNDMAKLEGEVRVMVFGCDNAANIEKLRSENVAVLSLPCIAMLPPSFIEYALHEHHVEGVFITGCRENDCYHRLGVQWTKRRLTAEREPRLRSRAERNRIRQFWAASADLRELESELESFRSGLRGLTESGNISK